MKVIAWPAFKTRYKNPYNWLLYSNMPESVTVAEFSVRRLLEERFDILHLHWPVETLVRHSSVWVARLRVAVFWLLLKLLRMRGTQVVWTIHDEKPHVIAYPKLADWFQSRLIANTDGYINLCAAGKQAVEVSMPGLAKKPGFVVAHGHYRGCYADEMSREDARSHFDLSDDARALLYLGYISPYKNVPHLVSTFRQMLSNLEKTAQTITLIVAGQPDTAAIKADVQKAAEEDDAIRLELRFIQDDELQVFFKAADLVVLPFEEILNSGSVLLALSFDRPVLAPAMGAVPDWQARIGEDWIRTYEGVLTSEILLAAVKACDEDNGRSPIDFLDWEAIAQQTVSVYETIKDGTIKDAAAELDTESANLSSKTAA